MNKSKALIYILPPILIYLLFFTSFLNFFHLSPNQDNNFYASVLLAFIPLVFLIQGLICGLLRTNFYLALGISGGCFFILIIICLNSTAMIYLLYYFVAAALGYGVGQLIALWRKL